MRDSYRRARSILGDGIVTQSRSTAESRRSVGVAARLLGQLLEFVAGLMLLAIVSIVLAGVFFRYFLHIGLGWTEEAARFLLIWMSFIGAAAAVNRWGHFQLVIMTAWIPPQLHRAMQVFALLVVMATAMILLRFGWDIMLVSWEQASPVMDWNMGLLYAVVPGSGAVMILFVLRHLLDVLRGGVLPLAGAVQDVHVDPVPGPAAGVPVARS
ncbi:TRAP transporter small permease [Roseomonas chloroacetimidivorans]|uniref:TRAP transporter small permease n=1 Tax=Roseomonas chloroacetimidivorans TaxID=1766656 RepID=UPI003C75D81A